MSAPRWTEAEYKQYMSARKAIGGFARADALTPERRSEIASTAAKARWESPAPANKFHATPTKADGIRFASKGEAALYERLRWMQDQGEIAYFLRQLPFHLPGNIRYVVDFVVFYFCDTPVGENVYPRYLDFKGAITPMFELKRKQVEALYPVTIEVITRKCGEFIGL